MKRVRLSGLLGKIEAVEGTDAAPAANSDGIQLEEHLWGTIETDFLERNERENATGNRMGRQGGAQPAGPWGKLTLNIAIKGAGAAYAAAVRPELDVVLRACGLSAAVDATLGAEKITYTPIDENHESATFWAYAAGSLFKLVGCRGNISGGNLVAARLGVLTVEIWGVLIEVPSDAALPNITYPRRSVVPPVLKAEDLSINGVGLRYRSVNWRQQAQVVSRPRGGAPEGHAGYAIVDYDPQFTAQIDSPDKSIINPWSLERNGTEFPWDFQIGSVQYNRGKVSGSNGQLIRIPQQESDNHAMVDLQVRCKHGAAAAAFSIVFD